MQIINIKIYFYNFIPKVRESCKRIVVIHDLTPVHEAKSEIEKNKCYDLPVILTNIKKCNAYRT